MVIFGPVLLIPFPFFFCLYYLLLFYFALHDDLIPFRATTKFICVKAVIFLALLQGIVISAMSKRHAFKDDENRTAEQAAVGLQNFLLCVEMLPAAIFFAYAFGYPQYLSEEVNSHDHDPNPEGGFGGAWKSFKDVADVTDVLDDTMEAFKVMKKKVKLLGEFWELSHEQRRDRIRKEGWVLHRGESLKKWRKRYGMLISDPPGFILFEESPYRQTSSSDLEGQPLDTVSDTVALQDAEQWKINSLSAFVDFKMVTDVQKDPEDNNAKWTGVSIKTLSQKVWSFQFESKEVAQWLSSLQELHQKVRPDQSKYSSNAHQHDMNFEEADQDEPGYDLDHFGK